jgi:hypothetical protein
MKDKLFTIILLLIIASISSNAQVVNGDFETWTNNLNPDGWLTDNSVYAVPVTKSTDKYSGQYAVKGEVVDYLGTVIPPWMWGGLTGTGFTINQRYSTFTGYYKFSPVNGDVFNVDIVMYKDSTPVGIADTILGASGNYSQFNVPINYFSPETPNRFYIYFLVYDSSENASADANAGSYFLLDDVNLTGEAATGIRTVDSNIPKEFQVYQNYPNPFNPSTTIRYSIPKASDVTLSIYDINGRLINTLVNQQQNSGTHEVTWNGKNSEGVSVVSGVYLYKVKAGAFTKLSKMILLK